MFPHLAPASPVARTVLLGRIAAGNVGRTVRDYVVYFLTLAIAVCLLYAFIAATDYLAALDLTADQRGLLAQASNIIQAFSLFVVLVFACLVRYANRFIVRRRRREFGLYLLLGMGPASTGCILAFEGLMAGAVSLVVGVVLGVLLSPLFGLVAAYVFEVSWRPLLTVSPHALVWTAAVFGCLAVAGAVSAARLVLRRTPAVLMRPARTPQVRPARPRLVAAARLTLAAILLAVVWGACVLQPVYFIVFIIPAGCMAWVASYLLLDDAARRIPCRLRRRCSHYWVGVRPFSVRQLETGGHASVMACACVLLAAGACMVAAGLSFTVGVRAAPAPDAVGAQALAPVGYVGLFFGLTFLVCAAAVLALQQLAAATDARHAYAIMDELGAPRADLRASVRAQVLACFGLPTVLALAHGVFGMVLVAFVASGVGVGSIAGVAGATLAAVCAGALLYGALTAWCCERELPRTAGRRADGLG